MKSLRAFHELACEAQEATDSNHPADKAWRRLLAKYDLHDYAMHSHRRKYDGVSFYQLRYDREVTYTGELAPQRRWLVDINDPAVADVPILEKVRPHGLHRGKYVVYDMHMEYDDQYDERWVLDGFLCFTNQQEAIAAFLKLSPKGLHAQAVKQLGAYSEVDALKVKEHMQAQHRTRQDAIIAQMSRDMEKLDAEFAPELRQLNKLLSRHRQARDIKHRAIYTYTLGSRGGMVAEEKFSTVEQAYAAWKAEVDANEYYDPNTSSDQLLRCELVDRKAYPTNPWKVVGYMENLQGAYALDLET